MSHSNDMQALVGRTERLVSAISDAILSAAEAAAERVELAAEVARVQQRLAAFGAVVDAIAAQKRVLVERLATAEGRRGRCSNAKSSCWGCKNWPC